MTNSQAQQQHAFDAMILGSGAAGLGLALRLADHAQVAVLSKGPLADGSTFWAQGGIAAVIGPGDALEAHINDTFDAGAGLNRPEAVRLVVEQAPACIDWLVELGVPFSRTQDDSALHLTREGGHSHRRIAHADDATGRAIEETLLRHARAHPNIHLFDHRIAIDLITARKLGQASDRALGAYVLDSRSGRVEIFHAPVVALATGGAGKAYLYTSNPDTASGDGIAMAWRAGCRVADMEFMQFHPTCLYDPRAKSFLISEAVRGEGGHLLLPDGTRFMHDFDPRGELAPRDIVARAIDHEMKRLGLDCVYLDISHRPAEFINEHFPNIQRRCLEFGYDMTREPLPVVPAAHYTCGGVLTDLAGRTDIEGLYAIGEVASTGLHGANRLASNSLLECLVFAQSAATDILTRRPQAAAATAPTIPPWDDSRVTDSDEEVIVSHNWDELRRFMWDYVGIVRTNKRLQRALHRADLLLGEIDEYYSNFRVTPHLIELRNLAVVAKLIIVSAQARHESRGLHYNQDYPTADPALAQVDTVLAPQPGRHGPEPRICSPIASSAGDLPHA
ncbi:L-aspartate oxidase [Acidihalobacter ferrooxydans]|uniref:L-aspartate oxidase n=1 Tax=Acidihalobacter ferrooxydans TaxID=1765967 RepID=UPI0009FA266F|nr:L-aspartate oxidase [Acidihalobacter ferrooxydans]